MIGSGSDEHAVTANSSSDAMIGLLTIYCDSSKDS
jgi:hypothetical protein